MQSLFGTIATIFANDSSLVWFLAELLAKSTIFLACIYLIDQLLLDRKPLLSDKLWRLVPLTLFAFPFVILLFPKFSFVPIPYSLENRESPKAIVELVSSESVVDEFDSADTKLVTEAFPNDNLKRVAETGFTQDKTNQKTTWKFRSVLIPLILYTYLTVTLLLLLRLFVSFAAVWKIHRSTETASTSVWNIYLTSQQKKISFQKAVSFRYSSLIKVPLTYGIFNPTIVVPSNLLNETDPQTINAILLHELTHIARSDYLIQILFKVTQVFYWCNPLVWLAMRRVSELREMICDGFTASKLKGNQEYINVLLDQAQLSVKASNNELILAMSGSSNLKKRLHSLSTVKVNSYVEKSHIAFTVTIFSLLTCFTIGTVGFADLHSLPENTATSAQHNSTSDSTSLLSYLSKRKNGLMLERQLDSFDDDNSIIKCWMSANGKTDWSIVADTDSGIKGYVLDDHERPLIGVEIVAVRKVMHAKLREPVEVYVKTKTDVTGFYQLFLEPSQYELRARVERIGSFIQKEKRVQKNSFTTIDIKLQPSATFRAIFLDSTTSQPVAGMRLKSWNPKGLQGVSNSAGTLSINNVFAQNVQFSVVGKNGPRKDRGVAGQYARWWSEDTSNEFQKLRKEAGQFQRNFDRLNFDVTQDMEPVTIFLEPCVTVRGRVLDPHGAPVSNATVSPARTGTGNSLTGDGRYMFRTNQNGEYEVRMPATHDSFCNLVAHEGRYNTWNKWANGVGDVIQTKPGEVLENVDLKLTFPGGVSGQVVDEQGVPQANISVKAIPLDMKQNRYLSPQATSDIEGRYRFDFLRPGKYWIVASSYAADVRYYDRNDVQEVDVKENEVHNNVRLKKLMRPSKTN